MVETALGIKALIIEKMADMDAGKSRWIAIIIFFTLIFAIALGIFLSPASELGTLKEVSEDVNKNALTTPASWPLFVAFGSGLAALAFEVVWFRVLVLVFGSTVYSFSAMLSVFLLGLAIGSAAFGP